MTPDRNDQMHPGDAEHEENGVLAETGTVDASGFGFLGGQTEQVSVVLPADSEEEFADDDVIDDEVSLDALGITAADLEAADLDDAERDDADLGGDHSLDEPEHEDLDAVTGEVEIDVGGDWPVNPQLRRALRSLPGVLEVEEV